MDKWPVSGMRSAAACLTPTCCPYLVDEGCESVIEAFDLLLLIPLHPLHCGVDLQLQGDQQALVDGDRGDAHGRSAGSSRSVPKARHATSGGHTWPPKADIAQAPRSKATQGSEASSTPRPAGPLAHFIVGDHPGHDG